MFFYTVVLSFLLSDALAGSDAFEKWVDFHSQNGGLALVASGVKPAASLHDFREISVDLLYEELVKTFEAKQPSSRIHVIRHDYIVKALRLGRMSEDHYSFVSILNENALDRLIRDEEAMRALHQFGLPVPSSVNEAIALYEKAINAGGLNPGGSKWASIAAGVLLGFPPSETVLYSGMQQTLNELEGTLGSLPKDALKMGGRRGIGIHWKDGQLMAYVRFSDHGLERDRWYQEAANVVMPVYETQVSALPSERLRTLNEKVQIPSFPRDLLMSAPISAGKIPCDWVMLPSLGLNK